MKTAIAFLTLVVSGCTVAGAARLEAGAGAGHDLGIIPIGTTAIDPARFASTDCADAGRGLDDCSATDSLGRRYGFFDGALSMVSAGAGDASTQVVLPAGMRFGEDIHEAARKAAAALGIRFDVGDADGVVAYSSPMVVRASSGAVYSMELISDSKGRLARVIQRTDF